MSGKLQTEPTTFIPPLKAEYDPIVDEWAIFDATDTLTIARCKREEVARALCRIVNGACNASRAPRRTGKRAARKDER